MTMLVDNVSLREFTYLVWIIVGISDIFLTFLYPFVIVIYTGFIENANLNRMNSSHDNWITGNVTLTT